MTHLWFLFSVYCFFSPCPLLPRSAASTLPLDMHQAAYLHLHCPFQPLHRLPPLLPPPGKAPVLCLAVRREGTATPPAGTRRAPPDTVCPRAGKSAGQAPDKSWRSLCRPGNRASGAGRKGPAGTAVARLPNLRCGGSWRSPTERRPHAGSACNCWLAGPCWRAHSWGHTRIEGKVSSKTQMFGTSHPLHAHQCPRIIRCMKVGTLQKWSRSLWSSLWKCLVGSGATRQQTLSLIQLTHYIHSRLHTLLFTVQDNPDKWSLLLFKRLGGKDQQVYGV